MSKQRDMFIDRFARLVNVRPTYKYPASVVRDCDLLMDVAVRIVSEADGMHDMYYPDVVFTTWSVKRGRSRILGGLFADH